MTKLAQERTAFIENLHNVFIKKTGHGAFAYMSITDAMSLFETYSNTKTEEGLFLNQIVRNIK